MRRVDGVTRALLALPAALFAAAILLPTLAAIAAYAAILSTIFGGMTR